MPGGRQSTSGQGLVRVRGRDDGTCCSIVFLQYCLYVFDFFFWLSGGALLGLGVWTWWDKHSYASLLPSQMYIITTYLLIGTGALIILVGFIGCYGACSEKRGCLMVYASFLLLIFLLEAVIGAMAYFHEATLHNGFVRSLNNTMLKNYMMDTDMTAAVDRLQIDFSCCGADSFEDWRYSQWLRSGDPSINNTVPDSCCKTVAVGCGFRDHPSNIYYPGCVPQLERYIRDHLIILGAVALGICFLQIFGIVFACCLARRIKDWEDRHQQANNVWM